MFRIYLLTPSSGEVLYWETDDEHRANLVFENFKELAFEVRLVETI